MLRGLGVLAWIVVCLGCAANSGGGRDAGAADGSVDDRDGAVDSDGSVDDLDGSVGTDGSVTRPDGGGEDCEDACTFGAERCSGAEVQRCIVDADTRCTVWDAPTSCPGGLVCSGDECRDTCSDVCTVGARRCAGDGSYQSCARQASGCNDWSPVEACSMERVCVDGSCIACTDGARRCGPTGVEQCADGGWVSVEACAFGCRDAMCTATVTCTAGAYRCNGNAVETCNSSGTAWLFVSTCAVGCSMGLCTGSCTPGATRCNGSAVETCNGAGTAWAMSESCASTFCSRGACAHDGLDVTSNRSMAGEVVVRGPFTVRSGVTLTATGPLTIRADSIVVEDGGSIAASPTGENPAGAGGNGVYFSSCGCYTGGGGGGHATVGGASRTTGNRGPAFGSVNDSDVQVGSAGGDGYRSSPSSTNVGRGGRGGGMIRLIAGQIRIAGQVTADGAPGQNAGGAITYAGGGGSGGGILIAADDLEISGSVSARGGAGGTGSSTTLGGAGADGRVRIFHGATVSETGTISGSVTRSLMPPLEIGSSTHPDQDLYYNDGFELVAMSWGRPYAPLTGYYWLTHTAERVPTPANATFVASELVAVPHELLGTAAVTTNRFQIVSVNPMAAVGTALTSFQVRVNRTPPTLTSASHPSSTTWSANRNVFMSWNTPNGPDNYRGVYYVFDQRGDTMPDATSSFVPINQLQVLLSDVADGVWAFHVVSVDTQGRRTRNAGHYRVRIGTNPGAGNVLGQIVGAGGSAIVGAQVSVNGGLFPETANNWVATNASGNYNISSIPVGDWELTVRAPGYLPASRAFNLAADGGSTTVNVTLTPE